MTASASRPSEFAPSNAAATKNRQLAYLGQQLGELDKKMRKLDEELELAARQHVRIRAFGIMQASLCVLNAFVTLACELMASLLQIPVG